MRAVFFYLYVIEGIALGFAATAVATPMRGLVQSSEDKAP
jgi:hypothetical protein